VGGVSEAGPAAGGLIRVASPPAFDHVTLTGVSRHFGRKIALRRVSLALRAGEITTLVGPNGAGKTTLLGILSTLVQPSAGVVRYGDRTAREWGDPIRSTIGMLGHELFLYGDLTARENLLFFARLYDLPDPSGRVAAALETAGLSDRAGERASTLSRGLRQRLALERALLHAPRLVLLDEPFTGLDDEAARGLRDRLGSLRNRGAAVVMATHDFESAEDVVDRVVVVRDGQTGELPAGSGTLRERYRRALTEARA
jgi:heme ABC exporter ATP-binding subunit CcmA